MEIREVGPLIVPEVELIDVIVGEPEAALVLVVHRRRAVALGLLFGGFLLDIFHGPCAGDVSSAGSAEGPEIGLGDLGIEGLTGHVEIGERFAIDFDGYLAGGGRHPYLSGKRQRKESR